MLKIQHLVLSFKNVLLGRGGAKIRDVQDRSGAKIKAR